mgnify:CR=1 FL=1
MIKEIDIVKGFQDFLPPESLKRNKIRSIIEKWFKLYGFIPIETPVVEFDELMRPDTLPSETEDSAVSDRFRLQDRGGRNLGLRYEFTFQLSRIFKLYPNIKLPFKRYQIGEVFRDEPTSARRFRQFTQCDIDIMGDLSTKADAECLSVFSDILTQLNINFEIQINNRKLLQSIIESVQIDQVKNVMKELDKMEKVGIDQLKIDLKKYASVNQILTLFKLLEKDLDFFEKNAFSGVNELKELIELTHNYNVRVKFNPFLTRGLAYYTGNIFEIVSPENKSSIAGGGRYDRTVGKYASKEIPAVGISFGLERVTELAKIESDPIAKVLLISISQDKHSIGLVQKLRKSNISCLLEFGRPSKALDFANSLNIPNVVFIGEEEINNKKFKLKNMSTGKEDLLTEKQLINKLN